MTKADVQKKMKRLKLDLRKSVQESRDHEKLIKDKLAIMEDVGRKLEDDTSKYSRLEEYANELQTSINDNLYQKQQLMDRVALNKRFIDRVEKAMVKGDSEAAFGPEFDEHADRELEESTETRNRIKGVLKALKEREDLKHLNEVLDRVEKLLV